MEYLEFKGKTLDEAITAATVALGITSEKLEYEIVEKGSAGLLGFINSKPTIIKAKKKVTIVDMTTEYLDSIFKAMKIDTKVCIKYNEEDGVMDIDLEGTEMGVLIGKRGQTLDSIQYLTSLFVNKENTSYIRVKVDTENYRARRKDTLENLAKNIAFKVKRTRKPITLEEMNPYERRIIHSALQNDKYVSTRSDGEDPHRKVTIYLKKQEKKSYQG